MPKISVVLPVFNGERYLSQSIESVINQTFTDWELIIVNDCSTDLSMEIMEKYAAIDDRIKIINNSENKKLPESLNIGFRHAGGMYYSWTSDDNIYKKNALQEMYEYLETRNSKVMVVANMELIDENDNYICDHDIFDKEDMAFRNRVGACFLYKSYLVKKIGEYNTNMFLVEDYEYWLRILSLGGDIGHLNKVLYRYRSHSSSLTAKRKNEVILKTCKLQLLYLDYLLKILEGKERKIYDLFEILKGYVEINQEQKEKFAKASRIIRFERIYSQKEPTIIYGFGKFGKALFQIIDNVYFFADKDTEKQGLKWNGISIISIEDLLAKQDKYQIIVALNDSIVVDAIEDLISIGVNHYCPLRNVLEEKKIVYEEFNKTII